MNTNRIEVLRAYYERSIKSDLVQLEKYMKFQKAVAPVTIVAFVMALFGIFIYLSASVAVVGIVILLLTKSSVNKNYKNKLVLPLMKQLGEDFSFEYDKGLSEADLEKSKLFTFDSDTEYSMSKLTTYTQKDRTISMCHVKLVQRTDTDEVDETSDTRTYTSLFFQAPTKLNIKTTTMVLPDVAERFLGFGGALTQSKKYKGLSLKRLDNPEFEKHFIVYGEDDVEVRYLLSHTVMERILEAEHAKIFLSFTPGYVNIDVGVDWLEPSVSLDKEKEVLSFESIKEDFELIFELVDLLESIEKHHHIGVDE